MLDNFSVQFSSGAQIMPWHNIGRTHTSSVGFSRMFIPGLTYYTRRLLIVLAFASNACRCRLASDFYLKAHLAQVGQVDYSQRAAPVYPPTHTHTSIYIYIFIYIYIYTFVCTLICVLYARDEHSCGEAVSLETIIRLNYDFI